MNLSAPFIRLPVMTTLVMAGILAFGALGYLGLPVSDLPRIDFPTISVSASLPGANPETMAATVATPLERQFSTIAGIDSMTSESTQGGTRITIQFALDRDIDAAAQDVQTAIAAAQRQLPTAMPSPPTFQKVNPTDSPILLISLRSEVLPLSEVNEAAETILAQRLSMVAGVAQVQVYGSQKYAVRVQADPDRLAARGLSLADLEQALQQGNSNQPTGTLYSPLRTWTIEAEAGLADAAAFRPLVVAWRDGAPVRLEQVAKVVDSVQTDKVAAWYCRPQGATRAIVLAVLRQPGTNTVEIVDQVRALLPTLQQRIPAAMELEVLIDRSLPIRASVQDVKHTLVLTAVLVVLVIFVFLRRVSATIIPALSLPLSLVGTFAAMSLLGYSLDNLSLMALTLATGFVVDDAIVVLENIVRRMEGGEPARQATAEGSRQIGFTVVSMTISLAAVFIPVLFMQGLLGRLFQEFAVTIVIAILISGFVSLTLVPMLCARFLSAEPGRHGWLWRASEAGFDAMLAAYRRGLAWSLRHRRLVMASLLASIAAAAWLYTAVPKGFIPGEDLGQLQISTDYAPGTPFEEQARIQQQVAAAVMRDPDVAAAMSRVGAGGPSSTGNQGMMFLRLRDPPLRTATPEQVIARLRPAVAGIPGVKVFPRNPPTIPIGGRGSRGLYQYTLQGTDTGELYAAATAFEAAVRGLPGLIDVSSDLELRNPALSVRIDRARAAALGVSAGRVEATLAAAYGGRQVSTITTATNQYWVILEVDPDRQAGIADIERLHLRPDGGGALVPLGAFAEVASGNGPLTVNHQGQLPAVTISFNLGPGAAIGPATERIEALAARTVPAGVTGSFQGTAQVFQSSLKGLGLLVLVSIGVIYLVLGILYESFIHPLTILSGLPSAGLGALLTLWLFGMELNVYAFVGIIMLIGIVKKNAIMMIDFAIQARAQDGVGAEEAITRGCLARFRPIMMTTAAALMGTLPLAIGLGTVSNSRRSLGMAVVGGLLLSQLITLFITPVVYLYLDRLQERLRSRRTEA